jgi:hypothetical protein
MDDEIRGCFRDIHVFQSTVLSASMAFPVVDSETPMDIAELEGPLVGEIEPFVGRVHGLSSGFGEPDSRSRAKSRGLCEAY